MRTPSRLLPATYAARIAGVWVAFRQQSSCGQEDLSNRLTDDEIANAISLIKMAEYARGGPEFYSVAQASQDR